MAKPQTTPGRSARPRGASVAQPPLRIFTRWTPRLIEAAEINADSGNLRLAADLCDWVMADDRVKGCLDTRTQALFGLDPTFERSGDKRRSARAVRALEADEDWWDSYPEAENALVLGWGIMLGVVPAIHNWSEGGEQHTSRWLPRPEFWHPRHIRFDGFTNRWMTRVASGVGTDAGEVEIVPGDGTWILHRPYGLHRPWAMGLWRSLARLVLIKHYAQDDWARLGETASRSVVEQDKELKEVRERRLEVMNDLARLGRDGIIVLPPGFKYKLAESSAGTKDIYQQQIHMIDEAIAVTIRGGNLTTVVSSGSLAATVAQADKGDGAKLRFDAQTFTTTMHDQSLTYWAQYNFGDSALAPWPIYPVEPEEDLTAKAKTMQVASTALVTFTTLGFKVDQKAFVEEFRLDGFLKPGEAPVAPVPGTPAALPPAGVDESADAPNPSSDTVSAA